MLCFHQAYIWQGLSYDIGVYVFIVLAEAMWWHLWYLILT